MKVATDETIHAWALDETMDLAERLVELLRSLDPSSTVAIAALEIVKLQYTQRLLQIYKGEAQD